MDDLKLEYIAKRIESMDIRGAAKIGRAAAIAIKNFVKDYKGNSLEDFKVSIYQAGDRLRATRPSAVSLHNSLRFILKEPEGNLEEYKNLIIERADSFIQKSLKAGENIARYGGKRIKESDVVMTHCNSSMAIGAILYAWDEGKKIRVIATESRPKKQGYITVKELANHDIPVELIVDSAVRYKMQEVDKVYVGADTIASNGAVINKIGTSQVALCAHESRVPVTVCAETYKFSRDTAFGELVEIEERDPSEIADPKDFPGVKISNPVFDATPATYIDSIITEEGIISPSGAYRVIKEMEE